MYKAHRKKLIITLYIYISNTLLIAALPSFADNLSNSRGLIINRPNTPTHDLPQYLPKKIKPGLKLPALSQDKMPLSQGNSPKLYLNDIMFEGNTIFNAQQLKLVASDFIGHKVTMTDLEELRYRLTRYYTDKGYSNSGALIKAGQKVNDGVVTFKIIEGRLNEIRISGTERLKIDYISQRIWPDKTQIFNTQALQEYFQLMLQDKMIERMDGKLIPGLEPGSAILDLSIERAIPYTVDFSVDNTNAPSTGSERGQLSASIYNLTSLGDKLDLSIEGSKGVKEWLFNFELPINKYDTRFFIRYDTTESRVIQGPLSSIDIENKYKTFELGINHPIWRNIKGHLRIGSTLSFRENQSFLLGSPFPFSPSDDTDGKSSVSVIRFWQDYQYRKSNSVLALRSTFNFGVDLFNATIHTKNIADGRFISWLGQIQYAKKVFTNSQLVFRANMQLSNDSLLSLEQFSLGGMYSIRGYRENTLVRDQAFLSSLELHYPLFNQMSTDINMGNIELIPFIDYGSAWNYKQFEVKEYLFSLGIGLRWKVFNRVDATLFVAHDIKQSPEYSEHNLQDDGIHFRINFNIF